MIHINYLVLFFFLAPTDRVDLVSLFQVVVIGFSVSLRETLIPFFLSPVLVSASLSLHSFLFIGICKQSTFMLYLIKSYLNFLEIISLSVKVALYSLFQVVLFSSSVSPRVRIPGSSLSRVVPFASPSFYFLLLNL